MLMQVENQTWNTHDWSRDGKQVLISRYVSINESYPALLEVQSGQRSDLPLPADEKSAFGAMAFSADGQSFFVTTDGGIPSGGIISKLRFSAVFASGITGWLA